MLPKGVRQGQTESGGIVLAARCWAPSTQRRCHLKETLHLPTFSHLLIVSKLLSLSLSLANRGSILVISCKKKPKTKIPPPCVKEKLHSICRGHYAARVVGFCSRSLSRTRVLTYSAAADRHHHMTTASSISKSSSSITCLHSKYTRALTLKICTDQEKGCV